MYTKIGSIEHFETIRTPKSYAFQVAHSILISHVRRSQIVSLTSDGNLEDLDVASPEASPEDEVGFRDEMKQVANTIAALPPRTRDVLLLRRVEGLSQRETAERLDIAEKTVEMHMARAVYVLMKQFGRGGKSAPRASSVVVHAADEESDVTRS
jgi:RNA polymerase sigma-70 factor (ECF subfamily)